MLIKNDIRQRAPLRGFTLIETLVAILVLMTALAGALALAAQGFNSADVAGNQITAEYLAQDAIEYIRFVRDSNCLSHSSNGSCPSSAWLDFLSACTTSSGCYFDSSQNFTVTDESPVECPSGICPVMYYEPISGFYNYANLPPGDTSIPNASVEPNANDNLPSAYTRKVTIVTPVTSGAGSNANEAQVTAVVSWAGRTGVISSVTLQENIFDWEP